MHRKLARISCKGRRARVAREMSADDNLQRLIPLVEAQSDLDIHPSTFVQVTATSVGKKLECVGFTLTTRFPNNFAIMKRDDSGFEVCVVKDITFDDSGAPVIKGHVFNRVSRYSTTCRSRIRKEKYAHTLFM